MAAFTGPADGLFCGKTETGLKMPDIPAGRGIPGPISPDLTFDA